MRFLSFLFCISAVLLASSIGAQPPNILLIMADDVGTDAIGCYGGRSYPTPHIDALAEAGMKFNHGYAKPVCHPSRVCLLTGRYPFRFGKDGHRWGRFPGAAEGITIADRLKQGGYATAVAGKWQLCLMKDDLDHPRRVGFDEWCLFGWHEGGRFHDPLLYQNGKLREDTQGKYGPDLYVEFLVDFMQRSHDAGKPFFAYYPMALCHDVTDDLKGEHVAFYKDGRWMTYAEMVSSMDDMVGRLVAAVDAMGIRENTLILFTTDNGTAGASYLTVNAEGKMVRTPVYSIRHNRIVPGGKGKLDDTGTRVPWIVNWPGTVAAGTEVEDMVDLTDLLPTMAELAGLDEDGVSRDGISFAPVVLGQDEGERRSWIYTELRGKRCVRSLEWRLYDDGRFFHLKKNPDEATSLDVNALSAEAKAKYAELSEVLAKMQGESPGR